MKTIKYTGLVLAAIGAGVFSQNAGATIFNDLTTGGSVTVNSGVFSTTGFKTAGTGAIDPFLQVQENGNQAGYNTSSGTPLNDGSSANFNHDLLLSTLGTVSSGGVDYYAFYLDLNQSGADKFDQITLNQVQIFGRSDSAPATGVTVDPITGRASGTSLGTSIWDMNPGNDTANSIKLDYGFSSGGSGDGDMELLIPKSYFDAVNLPYVVLYCQFGSDPILGGIDSNAGFEEWTAYQGPQSSAVPEPSTVVAGALLLLPLGVSALRILRKDRSTKA